MIYTVTVNPAIDYVVRLDHLTAGEIHRSLGESLHIGGKGINVSLVLAALGLPSRALGFAAGYTGQAIEEGLRAAGIPSDFVRLDEGATRINVKIKSGAAEAPAETEINGRGPSVPADKLGELISKTECLADGDTLVLAGSLPATLPSDTYEQMLARLAGRHVRTVVDATGDLLRRVLPYRPFLVKPNREEMSELFGRELRTAEDIVACARILQEAGAQNVLVSLAGDGALLLDECGRVHTIGACRGTVVNSVGAGDSMVAGFLAGCERADAEGRPDYAYALRLGTAAGGATAFSEGVADGTLIRALLETL